MGQRFDESDDLRVLLREALRRISTVEGRLDRVDLARLDHVDTRAEVALLRDEVKNLRESLQSIRVDVTRLDEADVRGDLNELREEVRHLRTSLAGLFE